MKLCMIVNPLTERNLQLAAHVGRNVTARTRLEPARHGGRAPPNQGRVWNRRSNSTQPTSYGTTVALIVCSNCGIIAGISLFGASRKNSVVPLGL